MPLGPVVLAELPRARYGVVLFAVLLSACARTERKRASPSAPASVMILTRVAAQEAVPASTSLPVTAKSDALCPKGMRRVPGGLFWVGSDRVVSSEEAPRFRTNVATFCMDETEATVVAYNACVDSGACEAPRHERHFCNAGRAGRENHPVNCVDYKQSDKFCKWRGARLPTEVEWEYAARGGAQLRPYSWGKGSPDGRACWKHPGGTCEVRSFPAGAFGLFDVIGNVWEWTSDGFGPYPWPTWHARSKVYRGGSWSRRFEKWMSPKLRNRYGPKEWGSHLGLRCAFTPEGVTCPYGVDEERGGCLRGVEEVRCEGTEKWNGTRCAYRGAPECPVGQRNQNGYGCIPEKDEQGPPPETQITPVTRARSDEFDADCAKYRPGRPRAWRYEGGTHAERNRVSRDAGCSNRDVGVGFNSTCCP